MVKVAKSVQMNISEILDSNQNLPQSGKCLWRKRLLHFRKRTLCLFNLPACYSLIMSLDVASFFGVVCWCLSGWLETLLLGASVVGFEVHGSSLRSGSGICLFHQPQNFLRAGVDSWYQMLKLLPCLSGLRNNIIHSTSGRQNQKPGKKEARKEATRKNTVFKGFRYCR